MIRDLKTVKQGDGLETWGTEKASLEERILELQNCLGRMGGEGGEQTRMREEQVQRSWGRVEKEISLEAERQPCACSTGERVRVGWEVAGEGGRVLTRQGLCDMVRNVLFFSLTLPPFLPSSFLFFPQCLLFSRHWAKDWGPVNFSMLLPLSPTPLLSPPTPSELLPHPHQSSSSPSSPAHPLTMRTNPEPSSP